MAYTTEMITWEEILMKRVLVGLLTFLSLYMNPLRKSLPENLEQVASGEISLPEVTKPVFDETGWKTENIEFTKKILVIFVQGHLRRNIMPGRGITMIG